MLYIDSPQIVRPNERREDIGVGNLLLVDKGGENWDSA